MGRRMTILTEIRDAIRGASIPGLVANDVVIGRRLPHKGEGRVLVNILPMRDPGEWIDGGEVRRTMLVIIAVMTRIDQSQTAGEFEQLTSVWEAIEPLIEDLIRNNLNGHADRIAQSDGGVEWEWDTLDDGDQIAAVGDSFEVVYERALGSAA